MHIERSVLRLFYRLCIPAGGQLSHKTLVKEWAGLSRRRGDLDEALRRLVALCYLESERTPLGEELRLTLAGHEYAHQLFAHPLREWLQQAREAWNGWQRRFRASAAPPLRHRRLQDRVAPTLL